MANSATSVANPLVQQANTATATGATGSAAPATASTATGTANTATTGTGSPTTPSSAQNWYNPDAIKAQMAKNGAAWAATTDPTARAALHQQNLNLGAMLGQSYNPNTGTYSGGTGTTTPLPAAYQSATAPTAWQGIDGQIKAGEGTDTLSNNGNSINATIYQGTSYATAKDVAQIFGGSYKQDPTTGAITINGQTVQPTGYDKAGNPIVNVKQALAAIGYDQNQIKWDNNSRTVTVTGNPQQQQQSTYTDPLAGIMGQMPGMPQLQPYQQPDLSSYYNNLVPYQTTFTPDWAQYNQSAFDQVNPTLQNSINTLDNRMGQQLTKTDEGLNAKGIFNSGIAVAAENQIRANTNDQVSKVIMSANAQIAKIAQTLYQDAEKQWSDGNHLALQNNQMWLTQAMNQQKQSFQQWLSTQQLTMQQANYALSAWDKMAQLALSDASNQMKANQFSQTQAWDQYKFNNLSADQQATQSLNAAKVYGYGPNNTPTLDTWKALGYMPGPDGKLVPTQQATQASQDYAIKLAQTFGYGVGPDGKIDWTEQHNNNSATQTLNNRKLDAQIVQWGKQNQIATDKNNITKDQLAEKTKYDQAMIDKAQGELNDAQLNIALGPLNNQRDMLAKEIETKAAALPLVNGQPQSLPADDPLVKAYNNVMVQITNKIHDSATAQGISMDDGSGDYSGSVTGPLNHDQLTSVANSAVSIAGVDSSWVGPLIQLAMQESSGDPNAVNSQAVGSENATGLMQTLPSTFKEYAMPGHTDIHNPLDNMLAAINYIKARYGTVQNALNGWAQRGGY